MRSSGSDGDGAAILQQIDETISDLILSDPELSGLAEHFDHHQLGEEVVRMVHGFDLERPLPPPVALTSRSQSLTNSPAWTELIRQLKEWECYVDSEARLKDPDLEQLALGLVWGSLIIGGLSS
jgi:hypothetical protein